MSPGELPVAVILAAGVGRRLAPLTDDRPKPMVEIDGEPILRPMLDALVAAGFTRIALVTGHRSELIRALLDAYPAGAEIRCLWNPDFASTNTVGSFSFAADAMRDGFVLLNGDLVFDPSLLLDLAAAGPGVHLVTDLDEPLGDEEMKVKLDGDGFVARITKLMLAEEGIGEFTGISRFDARGAGLMVEAARRLVAEGRTDAYYEDAFNAVANRLAARILPTRGREWTEIDDLADYHRAVGVARRLAATSG